MLAFLKKILFLIVPNGHHVFKVYSRYTGDIKSMISKQFNIDTPKIGPTHRLSGSRIKPFPTEACIGEAHPHISYLTDNSTTLKFIPQ